MMIKIVLQNASPMEIVAAPKGRLSSPRRLIEKFAGDMHKRGFLTIDTGTQAICIAADDVSRIEITT
jgi:hypothetical protein